jgi:hypothetical protein
VEENSIVGVIQIEPILWEGRGAEGGGVISVVYIMQHKKSS